MATPSSSTMEDAVYDTLCSVCCTEVDPINNPQGRINSCDHVFCSFCIKEWAKHTNVCPLCKQRFTRIFTTTTGADGTVTGNEEIKVRRRNYKAWLETSSEEDGDEEDPGESEGSGRFLFDDDDDLEALLALPESPHDAGSDSGSVGVDSQRIDCDICHRGNSIVSMVFCDRRQCSFVAHMSCLGLTERPLTFVCASCGGSSSPTLVVAPSTSKTAEGKGSPTTVMCSAASTIRAPEPCRSKKVALAPADYKRLTQAAHGAPRSDALPRPKPKRLRTVVEPVEDDLYFLSPTSQSVESMRLLQEQTECRRHEAAQRRQRVERRSWIQEREAEVKMDRNGRSVVKPVTLPNSVRGAKREREPPAPSATELEQQRLHEAEEELRHPQRRLRMEDQLAREWATDLLPVLQRNRSIDSNRLQWDSSGNIIVAPPLSRAALAEAETQLWGEAMKKVRPMVQEALRKNLERIVARREELKRLQTQRENAAIQKLSQLIMQKRQAALSAASRS